jgi:hypothetical protein
LVFSVFCYKFQITKKKEYIDKNNKMAYPYRDKLVKDGEYLDALLCFEKIE